MTPPRILTGHKAALEAAIALNSCGPITQMAQRYLGMVESMIAQPVHWIDAGRVFGPNGYGPAIRDVCRDAQWHADNPNPEARTERKAA